MSTKHNYTGQIAAGVFLGGAGLLACWFILLPLIGIALLTVFFALIALPEIFWITIYLVALVGVLVYGLNVLLTYKRKPKQIKSEFYGYRSE